MIDLKTLDEALMDRWLSVWSQRDPFSDEAAYALQELIPDDHFIAVVTLCRSGLPYSLIFRTLRSVRPAGRRLREKMSDPKSAEAFVGLFHHRPIDLKPFTDQPIITKQGRTPCSFQEAFASATRYAASAHCPLLYTYDGTFLGRA